MDVKCCEGCRNDFYNGNNPHGVKECWSLKTAKPVQRVRVHLDQRPPWTQKPVWVPDCYNEDRYIYVDPDNPSCKRTPSG